MNYREAWEANRLVAAGKVHPTLSKVYPLAETGQAVLDVHSNAHQGRSACRFAWRRAKDWA